MIVQLPWCKRAWALPFFTVLGHSKKYNETKGKKHKTSVDLAGQIVMVITRWLRILSVNGSVIFLGDGGLCLCKAFVDVYKVPSYSHMSFSTRCCFV